ncbi:MAG: T9SS type A sorting domain-containing protein [Bacteroidetes bacterium]|nr:T9SS type A sorting domain-containing protein [Bacteroidota bacterium]
MRLLLLIISLVCACIQLHAQTGIITTICGQDTAGYCGDGGPASDACLNASEFLRLDSVGNIYIGDCGNSRIRKIDKATGIIISIAGDGSRDYNGDNIPATNAHLDVPEGICNDILGNIYIADSYNNRIRKITVSTGIITSVAGSGPTAFFGGYSGDGGPATDAQLSGPVGLSVDRSGNIYIGDYANNVVRRVDAATGTITTFAGKQTTSMYTGGFVGYSGDGGPATNAVLSGPIQVFCDSIGNVFICDQYNNAVRKVDIVTNIITTVVGNGIAGYSGDGGLPTHAELNQPAGMYIDKQGNMFIAEWMNGTIRKISATTNTITTVAGNGTQGYSGDGGPATNAETNCSDVCVDNYGSIYIADGYDIRMVYNPKLSVPTANEDEVVKVYPNPALNKVTVSYHFTSDGVVQIMDITGHLVATNNLSAAKQEEVIDVSGFSPGMYLYRVMQNDLPISSGRIIKE